MERKLRQSIMSKKVSLGLLGLGLLFLSKPASAATNTSGNPEVLTNIRQKALSESTSPSEMAEDDSVVSRPTLISSKIFKRALLTSFSENLNQHQATFSNLTPETVTTKTEYSLASNITLNQNNLETQTSSPSLVALEPSAANNNSIPIPVSTPQNNPPTIPQPVLAPSSVVNSIESQQPQPDLIESPEQASNVNDSLPIPIAVIPPEVNNKANLKSNNSSPVNSSPSRILSQFKNKIHKVKAGDTLNSIASNYGISKSQLMRINNLDNPNLIKINQNLIIPAKVSNLAPQPTLVSLNPQENINRDFNNFPGNSTTPSQSNIDPQNNSQNYSYSEPQIASSIPIQIDYYNPLNKPSAGEMVSPDLPQLYPPSEYLPDNNRPFRGYIWPAKGVLTSGYGWRWGRMHKGIDIAAPIGTPIVAASDGEVISAGWNSGGYGNLVKLKHFDGSVTLYAHNSKIMVRSGQKVAQGEQIAAMGSTGRSTGPHLHFEIRPGGDQTVNPIAFLPKK